MTPLQVVLAVSLWSTVAFADVVFEIVNTEPGPIWVGIQGNPGHAHLRGGGFALNQGQSASVNAPDNWAGRFWPRTWCDYNSKHCLTGDCGNRLECNGAGGRPPATLLEITLKGSGGKDFYDISLVDGFNIRGSIQPIGGAGDGGQYSCRAAACFADVNGQCPNELRVNHNGMIIACESACNKFGNSEYCCTGAHNTPQTCPPSGYANYFKSKCPDAYSYAYDDRKSTFTCRSNRYRIQFGG